MAVPADGSTARTGHGGRLVVGDPAADSDSIGDDMHLMARLTQWSIAFAVTQSEWADSDSAGYANRRTGRRSATGTIGGMLDKGHPAYQNLILAIDLAVEESIDMLSIVLWEDGNEDEPSIYWFFPRVALSDFSITVNVETKEPVAWTASWGSDGKFYKPGDSDRPVINFEIESEVEGYKTLETSPLT